MADNSMLARFFEYGTQIALDEGQVNGNVLTVTLPHSAVLFLRRHSFTPDTLKVRMVTPSGAIEYGIHKISIKSPALISHVAGNFIFPKIFSQHCDL